MRATSCRLSGKPLPLSFGSSHPTISRVTRHSSHFLPRPSHRIFVGNNNHEASFIPLTGLAIGNGLTDPEIQYAYYPDMAYNSTSAPSVVSERTYKTMKAALPTCLSEIKHCQTSASACDTAYSYCNMAEMGPYQRTGMNPVRRRIFASRCAWLY